MALAGQSLPSGSWTNSDHINFRFQVQVTSAPVTPEVEIEPIDTKFTGQANFSSPALAASGTATVLVDSLINGTRYHWQARTVDGNGSASAWVPLSTGQAGSHDLGIDRDAPTRPRIASPTNPDQNNWYNTRTVRLRWRSHDVISGVKAYTYILIRRPHVIPPGALSTQSTISLNNLPDGIWFLALRAVDRAGNWSPTATFRVQLDRAVPQLRWLSPSRLTLNPYRGPTRVRFSVSKDSALRLNLFRVGQRTAVQAFNYPRVRADQVTVLELSGKDAHGKPLARGYYFFVATAIDHARNVTQRDLGGIVLDPQQPLTSPSGQTLYPDGGKRIIVSLSRQTLYAYDGAKQVAQTFVTTGNPNLPTPLGSFAITAKYHPFQFVSPWPPGSPYWYAPSWTQYAMLFREGGYFLHDAPWRSTFGPGTNGAGQPGTNFGGTHGCVNIPPAVDAFLFAWAPIGTPVQVVP